MNKGALDRITFETIETYVLDRMSEAERLRFEERLRTDALLREELELQAENIHAIELGGFSRTLERIALEDRAGTSRRGGRSRWLGIAAAGAVLVVGCLWWFGRTPVNERLFAEHFVPDPGLPVTMGTSTDQAFNDAMVAYKLGDHQEAVDKWSDLLKERPANDTLLYFIGQAALVQGNTTMAIECFRSVPNASTFRAKADWALFLAHVRNNDTSAAQALNLSADPEHGDRVRAILLQTQH